ncbi:MAG: AraC family transcriptional regulator [Terrimicrobiaceae bacterium]|nr:AraC family transcriptional regulator [Terrimicrobiaceae bacterium]
MKQGIARRLQTIAHYHQAPGRHPSPRTIGPGEELIELVTGGRGWVEVDRQWREVTPGALLWHVRGEMTIGRSDFDDPYRCLAVLFTAPGRRRRPVPRVTWWTEVDEVTRFAREVLQAFLDEEFGRGLLGDYVYARLRFQAELYGRRTAAGELPAGLARVCRTIEHDYARPHSIRSLAEIAGWSSPHLHDVAREWLGESPHQLLVQRRIRAARERLAASRDPVKQVAADCGFRSAAAFCHVFRARVGMTPAAYRKEQWSAFAPLT